MQYIDRLMLSAYIVFSWISIKQRYLASRISRLALFIVQDSAPLPDAGFNSVGLQQLTKFL